MSQLARKLLPQTEAEGLQNRRVLVVDDEPGLLETYKQVLAPVAEGPRVVSSRMRNVVEMKSTANRYEVVTAATVEQAITAMQMALKENRPFAMGFFDVRLGEKMDGVDLVRELRKLDPDFWTVFVTAFNDRSLSSIATELGDRSDNWDYLGKPFQPNEIRQKADIFTSLWNLKKERERQEVALAVLNRRILESERITAVAAVARGVAHEFGNLLMHIIGRAEITRGKSPEETKEALERIIETSQRASEILDRFNHLSDQKTSTMVRSVENLEEILDESLDLLGHRLKQENVQIVKDVQGDMSAVVHGTSVLQVFVNLLINGCHALEGRLDKKIFIALTGEPETIRVEVRDNGPGAPVEFLDKLMDPFFTTKGDRGTGLGLAICREIIEIDHQGDFAVGNHVSGGFQIRFSFPRKAGGA